MAAAVRSTAVELSYVLPIRWSDDDGLAELTGYLRELPEWIDLIVVDDSPGPLFERHREAWSELGRRRLRVAPPLVLGARHELAARSGRQPAIVAG